MLNLVKKLSSIIIVLLFMTNYAFCAKPKLPADGAWIWSWGEGKTAFVLKSGKNKDAEITMKLDGEVLSVNFKGKQMSKLKLQKDGSWKGTEQPSKATITMKKVDQKKLKVPKSISKLDGDWSWSWGEGNEVFTLKSGKRKDNRKVKFRLKGHILKVTPRKGLYTELVLQPDGSWIGLEIPSGLGITMKKIK